jgi:steroid 5-alpha reductase family enzyme
MLGLVGSATISFLLLRVSGVPMLEEHMKKRGPDYADYIARTSPFVLRPPRR